MSGGTSKRAKRQLVEDLYYQIVAQARQPIFYRDYLVPDTINGRFDMIILLTALIVRRLRSEIQSDEARTLADGLFEVLFADMDRSLREMGVGDIRVGKKVKAMAQAYYGRSQAYDDALDGKEPLEAALARNLYGDPSTAEAQGGGVPPVHALADYIRNTVTSLETHPFEALMAGDPGISAPPEPRQAL
ncbi:MAG: ubiquinol-cytochrome C chaperone [Alphaproteobacteria bacterium]|nr:ubiquinol-cytochrome C chaperone [Alphaproteobacteria bacterium]